jgi:O-methyltransferase
MPNIAYQALSVEDVRRRAIPEPGHNSENHFRGFATKLSAFVQAAMSPLARCLELGLWPGWLGRAYDIKVPQAVVPAGVRSTRCAANINIVLELLRSVQDLDGDIAECGVFRGGTLFPIATHLRRAEINKTVYGFDSFSGFDQSIETDLELAGEHHPQKFIGGFNQTSVAELERRMGWLGLTDRVRLVRGYFDQILPAWQEHRFCFVHIDCDILEAYKSCLGNLYRAVVPGGIILFDEYKDPAWPGCTHAVDGFLADKPEAPIEIERDNHVKYFLRKLP